ncbi:putative ATP-dependent RNA helicase TDRD12 [Arctopsyche grandis]|uniref:putative ATP-dependent RNA helicase TDRD12 n=1 Tax=Arctopsyche grandis TaxID=121162 RepID=UPI00406DA184
MNTRNPDYFREIAAKVSTSLEYVRKNGYCVQVVYLENPHIIFIKKLAQNDTSEDIPNFLSQIGLENVLPVSTSYSETLDEMTQTPSCQWTPGSVKTSKEFIREAKEIYYIPNLEGDVYKLFDNVPCTFGKLYLLRADNSLEELGEMLSKYTITVYYSIEMFKKLYLAKSLLLGLDETTISIIKRDLKEYIEEQKMINDEFPSLDNHCNSEEEVKKMCDEILEAKKSFITDYHQNIGAEALSKGLTEERRLELQKLYRNREKEFDEKLQLIKNPPQFLSCRPSKSSTKLTNSSQNIDNARSTIPVPKNLNTAPPPISKDAYTTPHSSKLRSTLEQPPNISKPIENNHDILRVHRLARNRRNNDNKSNESKHHHIAEKKSNEPSTSYLQISDKVEMTDSQERNAKSMAASPISSSEESSSLLDTSSSSVHNRISDSEMQTPLTRKTQLNNFLKRVAAVTSQSLDTFENNQIHVIENKNTDIESQSQDSATGGSPATEINKNSSQVYMKNIETPFEAIDGYDAYSIEKSTEDVSQPPIEINTATHSTSIEESSLQKSNQSHDSTSALDSQLKNKSSSSGDKTISDSEDPDLSLSDAESFKESDYKKYYLTKTSLQLAFNKIKTKSNSTPDKSIKVASENIASDSQTYKIAEDPLLNFDKYMNNNDDENKDEGKNNLKYPQVMSTATLAKAEFKDNDILTQICTPTLMLHSKAELPSRWLDMNSATFTRALRENLRQLNINNLKSSQTATWPIITRGHDTVIIGPKGSGKTTGFIVPLCNMISNIKILGSLPKRQGPLAWIVCSTFRNAGEIEKLCNRLLQDVVIENENISVLRIDTSLDDCTNACKLYAGCTILISTPYAVKLADLEVSPLNLKSLMYLVFDDVDTLNGKHYADVLRIRKMCTEMAENRSGEGTNIQVIATACTWNDLIVDLSEPLPNPAICINAFKECTLYANVEITAAFTKCINRTGELIKYLNDLKEKFRKIIIVCNSNDEVEEIYIHLEKCELHAIKALSSMNLDDIFNVKNQWENHTNYFRKLVLVCCDANLNFLNVSDANCLIHFSLPKSFFAFENRFATFIDNLPPFWDKNDNVVCKVLLFINEMDQQQTPKIVNFLNRYGVDLDDDVYKMADAMLISNETDQAKAAIPLCNELLRSGKCHHDFNCLKRHIFLPEFDKSKSCLPQSGYINFKINHIHSACLYSTRVLSKLNADGKKVNIEQNYLKLAIDICIHYSKEENRIPQTELTPGNVCIVHLKMNRFLRCTIVKIMYVDKNKSQVLIDLIDQSNYTLCDSTSLFEITEDFRNIESSAVEICVAGLMPKDRDNIWSVTYKNTFADFLSKFSADMFLRGRIILSIGKTIWLDNVQCCLPMSSCNRVLVKANVKKFILDSGIGAVNPQHMPLLYEKCKKSSWYIPNYDVPIKVKTKEEAKLPEPSWAFLDNEIFSEVYFSCGINPSVFFINIAKWRSCLNMLQKDIQKYAEQFQKSFVPFQPVEFTKGQYCIVKHSDDAFYRCRIDDVDKDGDSELCYVCFFVDYGDIERVKHTDVYPISAKLITQMPFQAIECRLLGLEKWSDTAIDSLYNMCFESEKSDILKVILAKYCLEEEALVTNGKKYSVYMFDPNSEEKESFYDVFVSNVLGECLDSEKALIEQAEKDMNSHIQYCLMQDEDCSEEYETGSYVENSTESCTTLPSPETALVKVDRSQSSRFNNIDISSISDFEIEFDPDEEFDVTFNMLDYNIIKNREKNLADIKEKSNSDQQKIVEITDDIATKTGKSAGVIEMSPHKTPFVRWYETKTEVFLKIELVGVEDYSIGITISAINFECVLRGTEYKLNIDLVGGVVVDKCSHERKGLYIDVRLVKLIERHWLSLIKNVDKAPWLKPDYDICDGSDGEDVEPNTICMRKQTLERLTKADFDENYSDDEEDEGDEDEREIVELLNDLNV